MASIPLPALGVKPMENPLDSYAKMISIRSQEQQQKSQTEGLKQQQLQTQQMQMDADSQKAIMKAFHDANGDPDKTVQLASQYGAKPQAVMQIKSGFVEQRTKLAQLDEAQQKVLKAHAERIGAATQSIMGLPPEQQAQATMAALNGFVQNGTMKPEEATASWDQYQQNPTDFLKTHSASAMSVVQQIDKARQDKIDAIELPGKQADADTKVRSNAASVLASSKDQADYERRRNQLPFAVAKQFPDQFDKDSVLQAGMTPHEQASVPVEKLEMKDWLRKNPTKTPADFMAYKSSIAPTVRFNLETKASGGSGGADTDWGAVAKRLGMSPQALDQAAEKYFQTGVMPPMGRGMSGPATNKAIMNRTAALHPEGGLAENSAEYKANSESLKGLQKQFDQVTAFENTAGKNLDVFLQAAKPIVDAGSPFLNTPVRAISERMVGSEKMAAFNAARTTALTEIAKVLNSSNASGVLSDSARHEVEGLIGPNANLKQIYAAANILKQDMKNRHDSYSDQIKDIQGRLKGKKSAPEGGGTQQPSGGFDWNAHPTVKQ